LLPPLVIYFTEPVTKGDGDISCTEIIVILFIHPEVGSVEPVVVTPLEWIVNV
jgi:hypothetical protein